MSDVKLAVLGECMVELQQTPQGLSQRFGGDTLNTALYYHRVCGGETAYVTGLGRDGFSDAMLLQWRQEGLDTSLVSRLDDKLPGLYLIETDALGERRFHYWRKDAAARYWLERPGAEAMLARLQQAELIYLSGISLAILTEASRERLFDFLAGFLGRVVFDNNYRPALWPDPAQAQACYTRLLKYTDMALLTFEDEALLYGDERPEESIARTLALGVGELVLKMGAEPCLLVDSSGRRQVAAERVATVVDTTAAGDSFNGAYLAKRLHGATMEAAARAGHRLAARVIQHRGAVIDPEFMPTF
ncbi:sugar kinase [Zobellella aerophila]|uniref:Sugar kinase n=1 Tax=Zobellella aerophila TaxID=870480 RepID=A0ABP6W3A9_9GAMM